MILSYMYPVRTEQQAARAKQGATKAAKHHYKRAKGARGKGGVQRGVTCSGRLNRGAEANRRSGATGPRALEAVRQGGAGPA